MTTPTISRSLLNRLRYKHLHMLVTLSSSQNLHRASQSLNMSQPAATRMLHEIEDMFGCDLFERLPRGMRPTALGSELIRFAESAISGLDRCAEDLMARQQGGYGYLSIGTIMGAAPDLVMDSIAEIKSLNPQLRIRIMGDTSDQVIQLLEQGRIDLAIARRNAATDSEHYEFEQLGNERLLVVVHAGHPAGPAQKTRTVGTGQRLAVDPATGNQSGAHRSGSGLAAPGLAVAGGHHRMQLGVLDAATDSTDRRDHGAVGNRIARLPENGPGGGAAGRTGRATGAVRIAAAQGRTHQSGVGFVHRFAAPKSAVF